MNIQETPRSWLHEPPDWWDEVNGFRLKPGDLSPDNRTLVIVNDSGFAKLTIVAKRKDAFLVSWRLGINGEDADDSETFDRDDLTAAFALYDEEDNDDPCDYKYEREYGYLNIPKRGPGESGRRNLSLFVSNPIRQAVLKLVEANS